MSAVALLSVERARETSAVVEEQEKEGAAVSTRYNITCSLSTEIEIDST